MGMIERKRPSDFTLRWNGEDLAGVFECRTAEDISKLVAALVDTKALLPHSPIDAALKEG